MKLTSFAIILVTLAGLNASASTISLLPSSLTPTIGSTFSIDLQVTSNTDEIDGFGLNYAVTGPAIGVTGFTTNPVFGAPFDFGGNPAIAVFNPPGASGPSVTLVSFTFRANSAGSSVFSVISDLRDPNQGLFLIGPGIGAPSSTVDLSRQVTINVQAAATPEPSTFGFGLIGAAGLLYLRSGKWAVAK